MSRRRSRIVGLRHRPRYIRRALVVSRRLHRWIAHIGARRQALNRSAIGTFHRTRRIGAPHIRAGRTLPLNYRCAATQHCARPRSRAPDRDKSRTNPDPLHRRHCLPVEVQSLLMIHSRPEATIESPRSCSHRPTIDGHQPQSPHRVYTARRPYWRNRHPPTRRMTAHNNHRRPSAATAWGPSPTEGIIVPGAAVVGQPAPWVARNPGVAVSRIVGPITGSVGIPPRPNPTRNPYIPCALYRIPVSVRIQVIPVFVLRIGGIIAHWSLL